MAKYLNSVNGRCACHRHDTDTPGLDALKPVPLTHKDISSWGGGLFFCEHYIGHMRLLLFVALNLMLQIPNNLPIALFLPFPSGSEVSIVEEH